MLKKVAWTFTILLIFLVIAGVAISWYASVKAEENLRNSIQMSAGNTYDVQFESSSINTFTSQFTVRELRFFDRESKTQINIGSLTFDLPYSEWMNVARTDAGNAINVIETGQIRMNNLNIYSGAANSTLSVSSVLAEIDGNIGDIMRSVSMRKSPGLDQNVYLHLRDILLDKGDGLTLGRGRTSQQVFDSVNGHLLFDASTGTMTFDSFRMSRRDLNVDVTGETVFTEPETTGMRETIHADIEMTLRTRGGNVQIGPDDAGLGFRRAIVHVKGTVPSEATLASFILDNDVEVSVDAEQFQFFPPRSFKQGAGRGLTMLGVSFDTMIIPKVEGMFQVDDNHLLINKLEMDTPIAIVKLLGSVELNKDNPGSSEWKRSRVLIEPKSRENRQLIMSMTNMIGFSLNTIGDSFQLPFYGTLSEPRLTP